MKKLLQSFLATLREDTLVTNLIRLILASTAAYTVCMYFTGAMILKQQTNELNKDLRMRFADLLIFIVAKVLNDLNNTKKDKL
jgi:hypothetical protein